MDRMRVKFCDMLFSLSRAVDMMCFEPGSHHQQVARLAYRIAEQMQLPVQAQHRIFLAGLLHDIGALSIEDRHLAMESCEQNPASMHIHAFRGAKLLEEYTPLMSLAEDIRYHHVPWEGGSGRLFAGKETSLGSQILYLAESVCSWINPQNDARLQVQSIADKAIEKGERYFNPEVLGSLLEVLHREHVWLELLYRGDLKYMDDIAAVDGRQYLDIDEVVSISKIFAHLIDFRNSYTVSHSLAVAQVAAKIGEMSGFSIDECKMLWIAGELHDLGKLAIRESILEKEGKLTPQEYDVIKSHTFYTYQLLNGIQGLETITKWASFHHENLSGTGYPFHLKKESVPLGARIMAAADVFAAVTEDRSYRKGMEKEQIIWVLRSMVKNGVLCEDVVLLLLNNFDLFTQICKQSQAVSQIEYHKFMEAGPEEMVYGESVADS